MTPVEPLLGSEVCHLRERAYIHCTAGPPACLVRLDVRLAV